MTLPWEADLIGGASGPEPGNLLMADPNAEQPWLIAMRPRPQDFVDECYQLGTGYAEERDGRIVTQEGLVIEKGKVYDPRGAARDGRYDNARGTTFCWTTTAAPSLPATDGHRMDLEARLGPRGRMRGHAHTHRPAAGGLSSAFALIGMAPSARAAEPDRDPKADAKGTSGAEATLQGPDTITWPDLS